MPDDAVTAQALTAAAATCDGEAALKAIAASDAEQLERVAKAGPDVSARLLASFERHRAFAASGQLDAAGIGRFEADVSDALGATPPKWWVEQLRAGKRSPADSPDAAVFFDPMRTDSGDRRGTLETGPGGTRVRSGWRGALVESGGKLAVDLSMQRVELIELPSQPGWTVEVSRARAGTTMLVAVFEAATGGFRFPLHAIDIDGKTLWTAQVCGPDRKALGGVGHLTVQIVVQEAQVLVFSAETHGIAVDGFDRASGARTLAWASSLWWSRIDGA